MCTETGSIGPIRRTVKCLDGNVPNILLLNGFLHLQLPDLIRAQSDDTCGHSYDDRADSDTGEYDEQFPGILRHVGTELEQHRDLQGEYRDQCRSDDDHPDDRHHEVTVLAEPYQVDDRQSAGEERIQRHEVDQDSVVQVSRIGIDDQFDGDEDDDVQRQKDHGTQSRDLQIVHLADTESHPLVEPEQDHAHSEEDQVVRGYDEEPVRVVQHECQHVDRDVTDVDGDGEVQTDL